MHGANGLPAVSVKNMTSLALTVLPDNLPALPATDPYQYLDEWCSNYLPSVNGNWVTWMTDDKPSDPNDLTNSTWYFQLLAFDMSRPSTLPVAVTWQNADAWYPCVDGNYVVWEDYRNDPDGKPDANNFMNDNSDIYLADLTSVDSKTHQPKVYPICTAPGPQLAPRISGHYVIWEDWRNGVNGEIYCYDLNEDTGNTGTPNWKRSGSARPSPDPAEYQLTNQPIPASNSWPDISVAPNGQTYNAVWLTYDNGPSTAVSIWTTSWTDPATPPAIHSNSLLVGDPLAYRAQARIDGTQVVWEDWRSGMADVYWMDLNYPDAPAVIGGSIGYDGVPDIGGGRVAYTQFRTTTTDTPPVSVYNVWAQKMLPMVTVTP